MGESPDRLDGRAAIVTGAGGRLGEAIAIELAARGARVLLADIDGDAAELAAAAIRDSGGAAESAALDVGDWAAVHQTVADFTARAERLDILVNNAARSVARSFWEIDPAEWDEVMAVNLRGVVAGCRAAGAIMREAKWGRIVNLGSLAGQQGGINGGAHYAASKAGIVVLTKVVAAELAGSGVTVNAVAPAAIEGPIMDALPGRAPGGDRRADPGRPRRAPRGGRGDRRLPRLRARRLHHRDDDRRQRRPLHALSARGPRAEPQEPHMSEPEQNDHDSSAVPRASPPTRASSASPRRRSSPSWPGCSASTWPRRPSIPPPPPGATTRSPGATAA